MTIKEARFVGGLLIDAEAGNIKQQVLSNFGQAIIQDLAVGTHDVTPELLSDSLYAYFVTVREDGYGVYKMEPKYDNAIGYEFGSPSVPPFRSLAQPLDERSEIVVLTELTKGDSRIRVHKLIWWEPNEGLMAEKTPVTAEEKVEPRPISLDTYHPRG